MKNNNCKSQCHDVAFSWSWETVLPWGHTLSAYSDFSFYYFKWCRKLRKSNKVCKLFNAIVVQSMYHTSFGFKSGVQQSICWPVLLSKRDCLVSGLNQTHINHRSGSSWIKSNLKNVGMLLICIFLCK